VLKTRTFLILLASTVIVGAFAGGWLQSREFLQIHPAFAAGGGDPALRAQAAGRRLWRASPHRRLFTLGADRPLFFGPLRAKADDRGNLFVIDFGDFRIKQISPDGALVRTYGHGKGQGPGEFSTLNDVAVGEDGTVWVSDYSNGRITVFGGDGEIVRTLRPTPQPYRLVPFGDSSFATMLPPGSSQLFGLFDPAGRKRQEFGRFIEEQAVNSLVLDGWVEPDRSGGFVYAGLHASLLVGYGPQGRQRFATETIEPWPLPKLEENSQGVRWVDREAIPGTLSLSVADGKVYLLGYTTSGLKRMGSIDAYDLKDGSYLFSRRVPEPCSWVVVTRDAVFTVTETTVSKWAMES
jgi:hypothetical protein